MKSTGIHHVALLVDDLEAARHFYVDQLGLELLPRPDFGVPGLWLSVGGQQIHVIVVEGANLGDPAGRSPAEAHIALRVDDLDEVLAELAAVGVDAGPVGGAAGVSRQVNIFDPAGNRIELNQPVAA